MPSGEVNSADLFKEDLYAALDVESAAEEKEIRKAYRKKALTCHPDKNPDNPDAAEQFRKLSAIFEVLVNVETRKEYDRILKAKKAAAERSYQLDAKRRKLKEDLERREREANLQKEKQEEVKIVQNLEKLLKDLRANGSKLLHEEQELLKKDLKSASNERQTSVSKLKIKWNKEGCPIYDSISLTKLLAKYGEINALVVSSKKKDSAIVEFATNEAAVMAFRNEIGVLSNRLCFEWIGDPPQECFSRPAPMKQKEKVPKNVVPVATPAGDFDLEQEEEEVFAVLRRAAEKQKLAEQMKIATPTEDLDVYGAT